MGSGITKLTKMAPEGDVRLVFSRADKVVGELAVEGRHCDAHGVVTVGTLFSLSQALCEVAIATRFGAEAQATAHEAKTIALNPVRTNFLNGEAVQLPAPEGLSTWQITIRREDGEVTAILSQGFVMSKTTTEQNQPAEAVIQTGLARPAPIQMLPSDKRINALVAAGTEVIARKGFAGATIREIAEQAGVHIPTFYQHIASKDELLEMVYAQEMKQLEDDLDTDIQIEGTAREKLERMLASALRSSLTRKRQIGILNRELKSLRSDARARVIAQYHRLIARYVVVIQAGIDAGEFSDRIDPVVAANVADMMSDMWALRPFFFDDHAFDDFAEQTRLLILGGLGVPVTAEPRRE